MKQRASRLTKGVTAAFLAGALLLSPLGFQSATAETDEGPGLESFSADGSGFALRVLVDLENTLPADAKSVLEGAGVPLHVDQYLIRTTTRAASDSTEAVSNLGDGFLDLESVTANAVGQESSHQEAALQIPQGVGLVNADVGHLLASVLEGPVVDAEGTLESASVSLVPVGNELPELQSTVGDVVDELNATIDTIEEELAEVLLAEVEGLADDLEIVEAVCDETEPVTELLGQTVDVGDLCEEEDSEQQILDTVKGLLDLPEIPNPLATGLASVEGLVNDALSKKNGEAVSASSSSSIKSVDVLEGFLSVDLVNLSSASSVTGEPGSAQNEAECSIADVKIGDEENGVTLDGDTVYIDGEPIPLVGDAAAQVKDIVDDVLAVAGLSVELCDDAQSEAAEDGTFASQSVSAFRVQFAPVAPASLDDAVQALGYEAGEPLAYVLIDPTVQTAAAANPAQPAPEQEPVQLPRTGAPVLLTILGGMSLVGGGLFARNRLMR